MENLKSTPIYVFCLSLLAANTVFASPGTLSLKDKNLTIDCREKNSAAVECAIQSQKTTVIDIFKVANPSRLVIDLEPESRKNNRSVSGDSMALVSGLRTGWHSDKFRIVLDLESNTEIAYTWQHSNKGIAVHIANAEEDSKKALLAGTQPTEELSQVSPVAAREVLDTPNTELERINALDLHLSAVTEGSFFCSDDSTLECLLSKPQQLPKPIAQAKDETVDKNNANLFVKNLPEQQEKSTTLAKSTVHVPTNISGKIVQQASKEVEPKPLDSTEESDQETIRARMAAITLEPDLEAESDEQIVSKITFSVGAEDAESSVHLRLSKRPSFNLARIGARKYRLRIAEAGLASEALSLPYFPPHTFPGISYIQAEEQSNRVEVTIGVERGVKLRATPVDTGIAIAVVN